MYTKNKEANVNGIASSFNWFKWYTPRVRVICHAIFWLLTILLYYLNYRRMAGNHTWLFILKDLFVVTTLFYATTSFVISKWLLKGKIILTLCWVVFAYFYWMSVTYVTCLIAVNYLPAPNPYWERYLDLVMVDGYLSLFVPKNIPIFILDFVLLISLPLGPKLMKSLMEQGYKSTALERDNLELELGFLKSQISPHFLFNTLTNIYQMAKKNEPDTPETILRLADMMRYILYESKQEMIPLTQEIGFIKDYIELARIRYEDNFPLKSDIQDIEEPYRIIPLLLIPFIENAFKHGPDRSQQNGWVSIALGVKDDILVLQVDNGVNKNIEKPTDGGVGMNNVRRRLALYYPNRHTLETSEKEDSFHVKLTLNLKK